MADALVGYKLGTSFTGTRNAFDFHIFHLICFCEMSKGFLRFNEINALGKAGPDMSRKWMQMVLY